MSTSKIEEIVKKNTGKEFKEILFELYTVKDEPIKEISELFACSDSTIRQKIKEYKLLRSESYSTKKRREITQKIKKNNKIIANKKKSNKKQTKIDDTLDKLNRIYIKTPKDIEEETGKVFVEIVQDYIKKGYSPSQIAKELKLNNQTHIQKSIKNLEYSNQEIIYPNIFGKGKRLKDSERLFYETTGLSLIEFLKSKYVDEGLSTHAIAPLFGTSAGTILSKLKAYGLNRNLSEARKLLIEKGEINYSQIHVKRTITVENEDNDSKTQRLAGELFHIHLADILADIDEVEVVIGYNNWFILNNKEVDIPIIVIDKKIEKIYKYAIEYQGEHVHSSDERKKSDIAKKDRLENSDWIYFALWDSPYFNIIENRVIEIIKEIIYDLTTHRQDSV